MQSAAEDLPSELDGIATEVHIQFPWGSLLRGVAAGDEMIMGNLRRICSEESRLQITIGVDRDRDRAEWDRLKLPQISVDYVKTVLSGKYENAGFIIVDAEELSGSEQLQTSWARRLQRSSSRSLIRIVARAT